MDEIFQKFQKIRNSKGDLKMEQYVEIKISHKALHTIIHALNEQEIRSELASRVLEKLNQLDDSFENGKSNKAIID